MRESSSKNSIRRGILVSAYLAVLLVASAAIFHTFWLQHPEGKGPAGPTIPRELFSKTWTTRPTLLLGIGDSVTAGFGATRDHSYFARLAANPADEFPDMRGMSLAAVLPQLKTHNLAVSGSTSLDHWERQMSRLEVQPTNVFGVVVITTGGNDLIHNYGKTPPQEGAMFGASWAQAQPWIAAFETRLEVMLTRIEQSFPGGCHIFVANIYDPTDGVGSAWQVGLPSWNDAVRILQAYNDVISRCVARHCTAHLVNIHDSFLGHGLYCRQFWRNSYCTADPHYWYYNNLEDPNDRGHDALRHLFLREIALTLNPK